MSTPDPAVRRRIAAELLGAPIDDRGYSRCPGVALHTSRNGARDFRLWIDDGAPNAKCVHDSCTNAVAAFLDEWRSRVGRAESDGTPRPPSLTGAVSPLPLPPRKPKRPPYDPAALERVASLVPDRFDADYLAARSVVPVPPADEQNTRTTTLFLDAVFRAGERALIFTDQTSSGDFMHEAGSGGVRLSAHRGVEPVPWQLLP